jgi:TonB family protein
VFETVSPAKASRGSRTALYEALLFSLAVHAIAGAGALLSNVWQVNFPTTSPIYTVAFVLTEAPPPPPPPPLAPKPLEVKQEITTAKTVIPAEMLAPNIIPDEIPVVRQEIIAPNIFAASNGVLGGIAGGADNGILGGVKEGDNGGKIGGTIGGVEEVLPMDGRIHIARDKRLPMLPLSQVYPPYPEDARMRSWEDELVVRYIIGKDGRVKDVIVLKPPQREIFTDGTVRAIRSWRFRPFVKDGEKQEVVHELTIYYRLNEQGT